MLIYDQFVSTNVPYLDMSCPFKKVKKTLINNFS